jgi:predicted ATPase
VKITSLHIQNFKSLADFRIENPDPFTVFVGANGVGKSNLFEALELRYYLLNYSLNSVNLFGRHSELLHFDVDPDDIDIILSLEILFDTISSSIKIFYDFYDHDYQIDFSVASEFDSYYIKRDFDRERNQFQELLKDRQKEIQQFYIAFSRIFIGNQRLVKMNKADDSRLNIDCSNLEKVLKRILKNEDVREEFLEWLGLFIPEFKDIQVHSDNISGTDSLLLYEKNSSRPFTKNLTSDGTYNILCLLTAVYQSDAPQFLCLEEPENGLNPYVVKELVNFFRQQCKEKGHYIWLNTHSQTLVNHLHPEELIVLNKINGKTVPKQFSSQDLQGIPMDEAWLTNVLGGGVPW